MTGFQLVGHPDWIPAQSIPITVLAATESGITPGAWGSYTVPCSSGGAYLISLIGNAGIHLNAAWTDVQVEQYDIAGNLIGIDFFGGIPAGGCYIGDMICDGPVLIRGNIYGASLQISGTMGTPGALSSLFTNSSTETSTLGFNVYILPNGFADPDPKVYCNAFGPYSTDNNYPSLILAAQYNLSLTDGKSSDAILVGPYSGAAVLTLTQAGVTTTPSNLRCIIYGYSVANGSTPVFQQLYSTPAAEQAAVFPVNLPATICSITWHNADASQTATVNSTLTGAKGA